MSTATGDFGDVLKRKYVGNEMFGSICKAAPFVDYMEAAGADKVQHGGVGIYWSTLLSLTGNVGWTGETTTAAPNGGSLPANTGVAGSPQASSVTRQIYGHVNWTNKEIADSSRGSEDAFMGAQAFKMKNLLKECRRSLCIALFGNRVDMTDNDGDGVPGQVGTARFPTGVRAMVNGTTNATTTTIDNGSPNHFYPGLRLLAATLDQWQDLDPTDTAVGSKATVSRVSVDAAGVITLTTVAAFNVTDNDLIVAGDGSSAGGHWHEYNRMLTGLDHVADDALVSGAAVNDSLFGISPITYDAWAGVNYDAAGNIARGDVNAFLSLIYDVSGEHPSALICQARVMDVLQDTMDGDIRYVPMTTSGTGGFNREHMGWVAGSTVIPILEDMFCPMTNLYAVNYEMFQFGYSQEFDWIGGQNGQLLRSVNSVNFTAVYGAVLETVCFQRNCLGIMRGITIDWSKQTKFPT